MFKPRQKRQEQKEFWVVAERLPRVGPSRFYELLDGTLKGGRAMTRTRRIMAVSCAALFATPMLLAAQKAPKAADLRGTWQLVSIKNLKTGEVTPRDGTEWLQLTKSHFTVVGMDSGRPTVSQAKYDSLSGADKNKADHDRVFKDNGDQVFVARGGTWKLVGNELHGTPVMAIYAPIIGTDQVLKIVRLDKENLVAQGTRPSGTTYEVTYRRLD